MKTKKSISKRQLNKKIPDKAKKNSKLLMEKPLWDDYFCMITFKTKPVNDVVLEDIAFKWVEHARLNPDYINIWNYPVMILGLLRPTIDGWALRNNNVANAIKYVRNLCAIRRDQGAAVRDFDGSWIAKTMPLYCDDYRDLEQWRANLSEKIASAGGIKIVEMERFGNSDLLSKGKK